MDLANRVTDSMLAFFAQHLPMSSSIRGDINARLTGRWREAGPDCDSGVPSLPVNGSEQLLQWQRLIFAGGAYNAHQSPGVDVVKVYSKSAGGEVTIEHLAD
jgi:hypothetical protein